MKYKLINDSLNGIYFVDLSIYFICFSTLALASTRCCSWTTLFTPSPVLSVSIGGMRVNTIKNKYVLPDIWKIKVKYAG